MTPRLVVTKATNEPSGKAEDLDAIFDAWSRAALGELDRSPRTVAKYAVDWQDFSRFVEPPGDLGALAAAAVAYRNSLRDRRLAASTVHNRLAAIKSITKWADGERLLAEDPLRRFRLPRNVRNPRSAIDQEPYEALLARLPALPPQPRMIIALAAYAGLRTSEIRNLNVEDVDFEAHQLTVRQGKGAKDRNVFMHPTLARLIAATWEETQADHSSARERIEYLCRRDHLSVKAAGERLGLGHWRLYKICKGAGLHERVAGILAQWDGEWSIARWMSVAGSYGQGLGREHGQPFLAGHGRGGRISLNHCWVVARREIAACPHRFRTSWVTILLESGIPLQVVAEEAGHSTLETTRGYIGRRDKASRDRLADVKFTQALAPARRPAKPPYKRPPRPLYRRRAPILRVLSGAGAEDPLDDVLNLPWVPAALQVGRIEWALEDGRILRGWTGLAEYCHEMLDAGVDPDKVGEWAWDKELEPDKEPIRETLGNLSAFADYMAARQN